ncbi:MAG: hypothetical protein ABJA83_14105, partial [Burkholderiaceae bacterium]
MTSLAIYKQVLSRDWLYRWLVVGASAVVAGIGLFMIRVTVDDAGMGFRWEDANAWFHHHPALLTLLWVAYLSTAAQLITLFFIHCPREPLEGNG